MRWPLAEGMNDFYGIIDLFSRQVGDGVGITIEDLEHTLYCLAIFRRTAFSRENQRSPVRVDLWQGLTGDPLVENRLNRVIV